MPPILAVSMYRAYLRHITTHWHSLMIPWLTVRRDRHEHLARSFRQAHLGQQLWPRAAADHINYIWLDISIWGTNSFTLSRLTNSLTHACARAICGLYMLSHLIFSTDGQYYSAKLTNQAVSWLANHSCITNLNGSSLAYIPPQQRGLAAS